MHSRTPARASAESGLVTADGLRHAATRKLTGSYAACGAGRIVIVRPGRFDVTADDACPVCADYWRATVPPSAV